MNDSQIENIRKWVVAICFGFAASMFWGLLAAIIVERLAKIGPEPALLFVTLPVALSLFLYLTPRLRKIVR